MIYNVLEQDPGRELIEAGRETDTSLIVRVPHSSGMLEGNYDENTVFGENDHRRHRPKEWLTEGLKKVEQLDFLTESGGRTLGQAALKFVLAAPEVSSTLPNIYGEEQIEEFAATSEAPDFSEEELNRVRELYENNFGLEVSGERLQASGRG
ncbi:MAG: aldo/keto reductase, partial [Rubrobacteraceae bacterium]